MKKIMLAVIITFLLLPIIVKANIRCNDGTISPSCGDCYRGCCSRHGGCSSNSNYESDNGGNYRYTTRATTTATPTTITTTTITTTMTTTKYKATSSSINKSVDENDSSSVVGTLIVLGTAAGGVAYGVNKSKNKKQ